MFFRTRTMPSTDSYWDKLDRLSEAFAAADAVLIGGGAGLSTSAGFVYSGERFERHFAEFEKAYGFHDMYSGGFYPYDSLEQYWAFWSRNILVNRYVDPPLPVYRQLLELVRDKDYFVLTTNADHCFQKAGFQKERLFYTQGDYGLWQCSRACHQKTYDNEEQVRRMVEQQQHLRIPPELVPHCPVCGAPMTMNLRIDDSFVQDDGWYRAMNRYREFLERNGSSRILCLELGVGFNTPGIIKYPFWRMTTQNPKATYVCVNKGQVYAPKKIAERSLCLDADIGNFLRDLKAVSFADGQGGC